MTARPPKALSIFATVTAALALQACTAIKVASVAGGVAGLAVGATSKVAVTAAGVGAGAAGMVGTAGHMVMASGVKP